MSRGIVAGFPAELHASAGDSCGAGRARGRRSRRVAFRRRPLAHGSGRPARRPPAHDDHGQRQSVGTCQRSLISIFTADEHEDGREADVQVPELLVPPGQDEVQRHQAEQRERVRGEDDERVAGDREDRRDLSTAKTTSKVATSRSAASSGVARRCRPRARRPLAVVAGRPSDDPPHSLSTGLRSGWISVAGVRAPSGCRSTEDRAEEVDRPVERVEQRGAGEDEDRAQDDRADDAPEDHPALVAAGTAK